MYLVTGGAGFVGSNIVAELSSTGHDVIVCDWLRQDERWQNLVKHEVADIISPPKLWEWLRAHGERLETVVHMGAISATTETDVDLIAEHNIRLTLDLLEWCTATQTRLIYASSAATYGDGSGGFDDDFTAAALAKLRPLNAYGWSKHVVDRRIARLRENGAPLPPQLVGLKFFNVYGPNEYHKGSMRSLIARSAVKIAAGEPLPLFRSYRKDYADGGQCRDFIYVKDCVRVVRWLLDHASISGLFNVGCGEARSWVDLAQAMFAALDKPPVIRYIDMPDELVEKYQYFTQARMDRLKAAGFAEPFTPLDAGVKDYVGNYLLKADPYR